MSNTDRRCSRLATISSLDVIPLMTAYKSSTSGRVPPVYLCTSASRYTSQQLPPFRVLLVLRILGRTEMRAVHSFALLLILIPTFILAGCGGSGVKFAPKPTGSFNNSSLRGSYAFSFTGANQFGLLSVAGSLQADGNGNFTAGV